MQGRFYYNVRSSFKRNKNTAFEHGFNTMEFTQTDSDDNPVVLKNWATQSQTNIPEFICTFETC